MIKAWEQIMISTIYAYSTCCTTILENIFNVNEVNYVFFKLLLKTTYIPSYMNYQKKNHRVSKLLLAIYSLLIRNK